MLNRKKFFVVMLALTLLHSFTLYSQADKKLPQYVLNSWGLEDGLPQNSIFCILQTRDGYLWLGTQGGLVRFDGVRFKTFDKQNVPQMSGNWVKSLYEDEKGTLWIGLYTGGLIHMKDGRFHSVPALSTGTITVIIPGDGGGLLLGTAERGVLRLDRTGKTITPVATALPNNFIRSLCRNKEGGLWIGTRDGLCLLQNGVLTTYSKKEGLPDNSLGRMHLDEEGRLWIATDRGLSCFHNNRFTNYDSSKGSLTGKNLRHIYRGPHGYLWITVRDGGLNRFNRETKESISYAFKHDLSDYEPLSIYIDGEENIWIGTYGNGLLCLKNCDFATFTRQEGLTGNMANSVCRGPEGDILVSTIEGISRLHLADDQLTLHAAPRDLNGYTITCTYYDSKGITWSGTARNGLVRMEKGKVEFLSTTDGLSDNYVCAILEDDQGFLWLGTFNGLTLLDQARKTFTRYGTRDGLGSNIIWCLRQGRQGTIWLATYGGGVTALKNGTFTVYTEKDGLSSNYVKHIYEDADGTLWLCTENGFNRFKNGRFFIFTVRHGLPEDTPHQVVEDDPGFLWFSSNHGVFRINKKELEQVADGKRERVDSTSYDEKDGMKSRECNGGNWPAAFKSADGRLWFPTIKGVAMVDPSALSRNTVLPPVVIEELRADGSTVAAFGDTESAGLVLAAGVRRLEIHYTALSFRVPKRVRFKYKLEGYDNRWIDVGTRRIAYYTKLPPGDYTFRVRACNDDELWNNKGAFFTFSQAPHFYQTPWFIVLSFLLLGCLVTVLYRLRVNRIKMHELELEQLVDERTGQLGEANSQLGEANSQLREQRELADKANASKSDFLARMSHDIRTPMNGVIGFTDILLDTDLADEQLEYVGTIKRSAEALVTLVNDILDFSKIEAGELSLTPSDFDPEQTAFDAGEIVLPRLEGKPVAIMCRIDDNVPPYVRADAGRFRQVLINLVGNAAKFTQQGEIILSMAVDEEEKEKLKLHVTIKDTGIGIPANKLESIFHVFQQAGAGLGGTGLGLPICRQIAALMQGEVWAHSTVGQGSEFHFTAWVERSAHTREKEYDFYAASKKILLAVENPTCMDILSHAMERAGLQVTRLADTAQAVGRIREQLEGGQPFDACIMEVGDPRAGEVEKVKEFRSSASPAAKPALLALSSSSVTRSLWLKESGFDGILPRPVSRLKLFAVLEKHFTGGGSPAGQVEKRRAPRTPIASGNESPPVGDGAAHIMLAEDNPINRKLIGSLLTWAGYRMTPVENGREAVEVFRAHPTLFDLILMDVQMPLMDGLEATKEIRRMGASTPIISMTASSMPGDREKCMEAGMNDYISKPIRRDKTLETIKKWLRPQQEQESK
ncbi:MAG: response regulator [bacterium]|nr:response regulator [bacterium]